MPQMVLSLRTLMPSKEYIKIHEKFVKDYNEWIEKYASLLEPALNIENLYKYKLPFWGGGGMVGWGGG